jgi:hypothetical protein
MEPIPIFPVSLDAGTASYRMSRDAWPDQPYYAVMALAQPVRCPLSRTDTNGARREIDPNQGAGPRRAGYCCRGSSPLGKNAQHLGAGSGTFVGPGLLAIPLAATAAPVP